MKLDKLNHWLTLLANFGVVCGLIALVLELRHSSQLAQVEAYQTRISEIQNMSLELALSNDLANILATYDDKGAEALTTPQLMRVKAWYHVILRQMQGQYYQYQQGFLDRAAIDHALEAIANGLHRHWKQLGLLNAIESAQWREEIKRALLNSKTKKTAD